MTEGTSQGLFIVVAIVIFGIFVVLAYILFEDTLSPALASMFTTATEQADSRLVKNLITPDNLNVNTQYSTELEYDNGTYRVVHNGHAISLVSYHIEDGAIERGKDYIISGYAKINGKPVKETQWLSKSNNTHNPASTHNFHVEDNGYFEISFTHNDSTSATRILHATWLREDGSNLYDGDIITIENFRLRQN